MGFYRTEEYRKKQHTLCNNWKYIKEYINISTLLIQQENYMGFYKTEEYRTKQNNIHCATTGTILTSI
jgi:hypothetical protein